MKFIKHLLRFVYCYAKGFNWYGETIRDVRAAWAMADILPEIGKLEL